jgi:hypothetical protein
MGNPGKSEAESPTAGIMALKTGAPEATEEDSLETGYDEAAESAYRAEARDRGEEVVPPRPGTGAGEPDEPRPMPPLEPLVKRIPAEVRDTLEELFRAKFVTVRRIPAKGLKPAPKE